MTTTVTDRHQDAKISQHLLPRESERSHSRSLPGLSLSLWLLVGASAQKLPEASGASQGRRGRVPPPAVDSVPCRSGAPLFPSPSRLLIRAPKQGGVLPGSRKELPESDPLHSACGPSPPRSVWAPGPGERSAGCVPEPLSARAPPACHRQVCAHGGSVRGAGKHRLG